MEDTSFVPADFADDQSQSVDLSAEQVSLDSSPNRPRDFHIMKIPSYCDYMDSHGKVVSNRNKKFKTIKIYDSTCVVGATIRSAKSGNRLFGHKVGSCDEDLYFKVVETTHPPNDKGLHVPYFLYYESPEQWEKHFSTKCADSIKDLWREKYNRAIIRRMNQSM
jgi:hypothetical protein